MHYIILSNNVYSATAAVLNKASMNVYCRAECGVHAKFQHQSGAPKLDWKSWKACKQTLEEISPGGERAFSEV